MLLVSFDKPFISPPTKLLKPELMSLNIFLLFTLLAMTSPWQSCNEDSSKILGEACWYRINDFVATFGTNDKPIYMAFSSLVYWTIDTGFRPSEVDD